MRELVNRRIEESLWNGKKSQRGARKRLPKVCLEHRID